MKARFLVSLKKKQQEFSGKRGHSFSLERLPRANNAVDQSFEVPTALKRKSDRTLSPIT